MARWHSQTGRHGPELVRDANRFTLPTPRPRWCNPMRPAQWKNPGKKTLAGCSGEAGRRRGRNSSHNRRPGQTGLQCSPATWAARLQQRVALGTLIASAGTDMPFPQASLAVVAVAQLNRRSVTMRAGLGSLVGRNRQILASTTREQHCRNPEKSWMSFHAMFDGGKSLLLPHFQQPSRPHRSRIAKPRAASGVRWIYHRFVRRGVSRATPKQLDRQRNDCQRNETHSLAEHSPAKSSIPGLAARPNPEVEATLKRAPNPLCAFASWRLGGKRRNAKAPRCKAAKAH